METMFNPEGDGNCGFRALAMAIKGDENKWADIKQEMLEHFLSKMETFYIKRWSPDIIESTKKILLDRRSPNYDTVYWYTEPECSQIACNKYKIPIASYMNSRWGIQKFFYVPIFDKIKTSRPIILQNTGSHIHYVTLKPRVHMVWPRTYPGYPGDCKLTGITDQSVIYNLEENSIDPELVDLN